MSDESKAPTIMDHFNRIFDNPRTLAEANAQELSHADEQVLSPCATCPHNDDVCCGGVV